MAKNYGINFCRKGIRVLEQTEDKLIEKTGFGFDYYSREAVQLRQYKHLLRKFTAERDSGRHPSYDQERHGRFEE